MKIGINHTVNDPVLHYRLDPGEPGILRQTNASRSFIEVSAQERRNLNRLKRQASREGRQVVFAQIKFQYGIDGSYNSLRAGETTVVSKKAGENTQAAETPAQPENESLQEPEDNTQDPAEQLQEAALTERDETDIEQESDDLQQEKNRLEFRLKEIKLTEDDNTPQGIVPAEDTENEKARISQKIEDVDRKLSRLEREKFSLKIEQQNKKTNEAIKKIQNTAGSLLPLALGGRNISPLDQYTLLNKDVVKNYINQTA